MRIKPIVEGHGEVRAVPELLRRICHAGEVYDVAVLNPIRVHRSDFDDKGKIENQIAVARLDSPDAILVLFDADDDCPAEIAGKARMWARSAANPIPCEVVVANREYETWFLGAIGSLRGKSGISVNAATAPNPEQKRDAKGEVSRRMEGNRSYLETVDQVALTPQMELSMAHQTCRSFRKLVKDVGLLLGANDLAPAVWPPAGW